MLTVDRGERPDRRLLDFSQDVQTPLMQTQAMDIVKRFIAALPAQGGVGAARTPPVRLQTVLTTEATTGRGYPDGTVPERRWIAACDRYMSRNELAAEVHLHKSNQAPTQRAARVEDLWQRAPHTGQQQQASTQPTSNGQQAYGQQVMGGTRVQATTDLLVGDDVVVRQGVPGVVIGPSSKDPANRVTVSFAGREWDVVRGAIKPDFGIFQSTTGRGRLQGTFHRGATSAMAATPSSVMCASAAQRQPEEIKLTREQKLEAYRLDNCGCKPKQIAMILSGLENLGDPLFLQWHTKVRNLINNSRSAASSSKARFA